MCTAVLQRVALLSLIGCNFSKAILFARARAACPGEKGEK